MIKDIFSNAIKEWLQTHLITYEIIEDYINKSRNKVYKLFSPNGFFFLKLHCNRQHWNKECYAYKNCTKLAPKYFPKLISIFDSHTDYGILTSSLPGLPLEIMNCTKKVNCSVWYDAGKLAAKLNKAISGQWFGVPDFNHKNFSPFFYDPVKYTVFNIQKWLNKSLLLKILEHKEKELVDWALNNCKCFENEKPCLVNTDYTPGNWIVNKDGKFLGVVDLEDMHWGIRAENFAHLWTKFTSFESMENKAFYDGYEEDFYNNNPIQSIIACIKLALATRVYGSSWQSLKHINNSKTIFNWIINIMKTNFYI